MIGSCLAHSKYYLYYHSDLSSWKPKLCPYDSAVFHDFSNSPIFSHFCEVYGNFSVSFTCLGGSAHSLDRHFTTVCRALYWALDLQRWEISTLKIHSSLVLLFPNFTIFSWRHWGLLTSLKTFRIQGDILIWFGTGGKSEWQDLGDKHHFFFFWRIRCTSEVGKIHSHRWFYQFLILQNTFLVERSGVVEERRDT